MEKSTLRKLTLTAISSIFLIANGLLIVACSSLQVDISKNNAQELIKTKKCPKCTLHHANLRNADLENANLENAQLQWSSMNGANLRGANLKGAYLGGSMINTNLEGADLRGAIISADLRKSNLTNANLDGAFLRRPNFRNADLKNIDFSKTLTNGLNEHNLPDFTNAKGLVDYNPIIGCGPYGKKDPNIITSMDLHCSSEDLSDENIQKFFSGTDFSIKRIERLKALSDAKEAKRLKEIKKKETEQKQLAKERKKREENARLTAIMKFESEFNTCMESSNNTNLEDKQKEIFCTTFAQQTFIAEKQAEQREISWRQAEADRRLAEIEQRKWEEKPRPSSLFDKSSPKEESNGLFGGFISGFFKGMEDWHKKPVMPKAGSSCPFGWHESGSSYCRQN